MKTKHKLGVSFSLHRCSELLVGKEQVLKAALEDLGFRRFRLMSYWNIHEPAPGEYNFDELDWQLDLVHKYGGEVTLCLGKRQPRWPECHMPPWAAKLPREQWYAGLYKYIEIVVRRYKGHPALVSWQLENEALLKDFGYCPDQDFSRARLQQELNIVKKLDPVHPVIMTLSDSWGIPFRIPTPDAYAMSLYRITINEKGRYAYSKRPASFYKLRASLIHLLKGKPVFIHELQAEPWLKTSLMNNAVDEQLRYMNAKILRDAVNFALKTNQSPIDLWGLEWWYMLKEKHSEDSLWKAAKGLLK